MTQSIEEARQLVLEQARIVAAGLDHPDTILAAADAYALAVLDEAMASAPLGAAYVRDWKERRNSDLQRRIEAAP